MTGPSEEKRLIASSSVARDGEEDRGVRLATLSLFLKNGDSTKKRLLSASQRRKGRVVRCIILQHVLRNTSATRCNCSRRAFQRTDNAILMPKEGCGREVIATAGVHWPDHPEMEHGGEPSSRAPRGRDALDAIWPSRGRRSSSVPIAHASCALEPKSQVGFYLDQSVRADRGP